jgi:hypothetical protein
LEILNFKISNQKFLKIFLERNNKKRLINGIFFNIVYFVIINNIKNL